MRAVVVSLIVLVSAVPLVPDAAAATHTVSAVNFAWSPDELLVAPGDAVQFVLGAGSHNLVPDWGADACSLPCTIAFEEEGAYPYHCGFHPSMVGTVLVGTPPTVTIDSPAAGATGGGVVVVTGTATHASGSFDDFDVRIGAATPTSLSGTTIPGGMAWTAHIPTAALANGAQTIVARATTSGGIPGTATRAIVVDNPVSIDVALLSASAQQGATTTNTVSFVLRNQGNAPSPVTVFAEYLYHGTWRPIGTTTVASVAPGANAGGSIAWTPSVPHVGAFSVRVTADPDAALPDPNRANNVRTITAGWITTAVPGVVLTEPT